MNFRHTRRTIAILTISFMLPAPTFAPHARAAQPWRFHLEEATIAHVHRAIRARQITATQLVQFYFKRIEAYNGACVKATSIRLPG